MDQTTKTDYKSLLAGSLILFMGIIIGNMFTGDSFGKFVTQSQKGQSIESQRSEELISKDVLRLSEEQLNAANNIKKAFIVHGTAEDLKTLYNIDVNKYLSKTPEGSTEQAITTLLRTASQSSSSSTSSPSNPDQINFSCYFSGFGPLQVFEGGFTSYANDWWGTPYSSLTVCIISGIW